MTALSPSLLPERIFVAPDAAEDSMTKRVLARLPEVPVHALSQREDPFAENSQAGELSAAERFSRGKKTLVLTRYLGSWLRACPGTSQHVCCNLWTVNPGEGCPMECTYCYLQSYLQRNPSLKIYTNTQEMLQTIEEKASANPNRLFRVGTGEVIDSLVWDPITDWTSEFVPFFARVPNIMLELKTKSASIGNLLKLKDEHQGKTVVSWSVNARSVTEQDEALTASLDERLAAARQVSEAGYRVGFHFDPIIYFAGWEDEYRDTIRRIAEHVPAKSIAWVSISTLRYRKDLQEMMIQRFPKSRVPFGEQFFAKDGKLRYIQPLRFKMSNFIWQELKAIDPQLPVYMCMESSAAWHHIAGGPPVAGSELVEIFSRRGRLPMVENAS